MFGFLGALLGLAGTAIGAAAQSKTYSDNLDLQKQQFSYQIASDNWSRQFASDNEAFNRSAFQQQMALAQSPVSSVVNDGRSVGVNPMAALGQSAGSASYSSTSAPSAGASVSPVSLQDGILSSFIGNLTSLASSKMNNDTARQIADKQAALKQQELDIIRENNHANIGLGSERNAISRLEANIHQQLADANDRMTEGQLEKWLNDNSVSLRSIALQEAAENYKQMYSDRQFAELTAQFNRKFEQEYDKLKSQISTADKDRRAEYILGFSRMVGEIVKGIFIGL